MKVCYINFNIDNPRDRITLQGLKMNGVEVVEIVDKTPGWNKYINIARTFSSVQDKCDIVMVGYAGSVLVIFLRLIMWRKIIIYNALATFYDSMIVSRFGGNVFNIKALWYYLVDFVAFRCADLTFIECQAQKDLIVRVFKIKPEKMLVHFVGTDEKEFYFDKSIPKRKQFTVVFRGMFLPEAGADVVVRIAKELEKDNIYFIIIGRGLLHNQIENLVTELKPTNLELITAFIPTEELRVKMLECHISLGQLADHPRVQTTIPHKVFESMAMRLPYLTGRNKGVMEILKDDETCFTASPGDYKTLATKIRELRDNPEKLDKVAQNGYELYKREYTPEILARKIMDELAQRSIGKSA
ncbi:MAG: hypothetical protein A3C62_00665 [Candidatus Zambryskibacteria bacterium RIFCSPHIGHO2_02_FULL_39_16]|nr:MAG: hypothetical protein A3C62_00665 [Candidatus Zambryskibacteria bacterium RIFCSPHIGHO2_02_FULL_39_16]